MHNSAAAGRSPLTPSFAAVTPRRSRTIIATWAGLAALFAGFELLSLTQEEQRRPGSWHWHILAERR